MNPDAGLSGTATTDDLAIGVARFAAPPACDR
jgi:hypothetical protein